MRDSQKMSIRPTQDQIDLAIKKLRFDAQRLRSLYGTDNRTGRLDDASAFEAVAGFLTDGAPK